MWDLEVDFIQNSFFVLLRWVQVFDGVFVDYSVSFIDIDFLWINGVVKEFMGCVILLQL